MTLYQNKTPLCCDNLPLYFGKVRERQKIVFFMEKKVNIAEKKIKTTEKEVKTDQKIVRFYGKRG